MDRDAATSSQLLLYEERLEDMRQELVRQYQEHQQATELLRQGHMQQMERQRESQDQLLAELERLKMQLAEVIQNSTSELTKKHHQADSYLCIYIYLEGERGMHVFIMCMNTHPYLCVCVCVQIHICMYL